MYTVLVRYKEYQEAPHVLLDGEWIEKSQVVKIPDLTELNGIFKQLIKIDILQTELEKQQAERMYSEEDMLEFGKFCHNDAHSTNRVKTFKELLEQFKDK